MKDENKKYLDLEITKKEIELAIEDKKLAKQQSQTDSHFLHWILFLIL